MWTSPDDIANHPEDLNTFGGLNFDGRYAGEALTGKVPFCDPFPRGPLPRMLARLKPVDKQVPVSSPDAEWRSLEGLRFLLWHLKYILCGGEEQAFEYLMQWFGYIFQYRRKPGVMPQFLSEAEGIGKCQHPLRRLPQGSLVVYETRSGIRIANANCSFSIKKWYRLHGKIGLGEGGSGSADTPSELTASRDSWRSRVCVCPKTPASLRPLPPSCNTGKSHFPLIPECPPGHPNPH